MKRIINTSVPVVVTTIRTPLSTSLTIAQSGENGGPLTQAQDTQQNPQVWIPDRRLHPLILTPLFVAKDTGTGETITSGYDIKWYIVNGDTQTQITSTVTSQDYYLEQETVYDEESGESTTRLTGRLVVRKNVDYRTPVTLRCVATYTDNLRQEIYTKESIVTLTSTNMPEENYVVSLQAPAVITYDPVYIKTGNLANGLFQNGSKFRLSAKTMLGSNDATSGVYYFWYIDGQPIVEGLDFLQYSQENQLAGKGLGTDTIVLDMDYAEKFKGQVQIGTFNEVGSPTGNPKTKGYYEMNGNDFVLTTDTTVNASKVYYTKPSAPNLPSTDERTMMWEWPDIDNEPFSHSGNAVRSSSGSKVFEAIVQADGVDLDDAFVDEHIRLDWHLHPMNSSTVTDLGYGRTMAVDHAALNRTGGEHVEVYADTCLLGPLTLIQVSEDDDTLITTDDGNSYIVCRT